MNHLEQAKKELAWLDDANEESYRHLGTSVAMTAIAHALVSIAENLDHFRKTALPVEIFKGDF